jgi:hypothetical protein
VRRSSSAVVILASPNTVAHSPKLRLVVMMTLGKRDVTAASHYAAIACERAVVHFHGSSSSIFVFG